GFDWLDTLSHEYVHYLLTKKSRNTLPLWMHEGIAKMLESRWRGEKKYLTPLMETILADGLAQDYLVSLDRMMPSFAKLETAEDVQLAYAEVSTMVEYLTETQGEPALATLLEDLASGVPFEKALGEGVGTDLPTFQENWKRYMKTQKELKSIPGLRVLKIRFKKDRSLEEQEKDYREVGSRRAQDLTFLGDILKSRNEYKAALLEYEKAFEANKTENPILYNKLAGTYMVTQEYDRAETLLTRSLRYYPTFHTTLVNLGELYLQTGRTQPARDSFEKALRINPFNPIVHERLIQIYDRLQMPEQKKTQENLYGYLQ
nr:tetratricopeptide repeat protein [Nitrospinaceae bacterium]NIR57724.1 tetratricopeptide repeat protein [Nitrospinaceae bacterium]NIS88184.1 tetratricopeptide repeat protein [Nitrospinaceae bacterium]NIT85066.1 tetratricopeptide repeat protein [Nitrospinaceae bacterium]NIU47224.1 tetratricopeptide repeat protein [Nitrospinaceae bacterium]